MSMWAIILRPWLDEPVYHAPAKRWDVRGRYTTLCGRAISEYTPWLPAKHVKKFGRPCKGCFGK